METKAIEIRNKLYSKPLEVGQYSIVDIPGKIFNQVLNEFPNVGEEKVIDNFAVTGKYVDLCKDEIDDDKKVFMLLIEKTEGETKSAKLVLTRREPQKPNFIDDYDFEIKALPVQYGWTAGIGNQSEEQIFAATPPFKKLDRENPMLGFAAFLMMALFGSADDPKAVSRRFADGALSSGL